MKRAVFFVLFLVLVYASFSQNLVVNPGLETWGTTGKPTDWTNTQSCLKDSVFVKSGNYSCRQEGTTISRDLGQKFSVSPGKKYRFTVFFKTGSTTTGNGCRIWSEWLDETKVSINDPASLPILHSVYMKSDTWQQFSCEVTSPEGAAYFYLLVRTLSNSVTYWDDFVFVESVPTNNSKEQLAEIKVYPNPAHDYLIISNAEEIKHINIQNLKGTSFISKDYSGEDKVLIPVSSLSKGLYLIRIRAGEKMITEKIIIE